jgi:ring-1,2-phenylacetyl-CoA epoxidase subunit PaaE
VVEKPVASRRRGPHCGDGWGHPIPRGFARPTDLVVAHRRAEIAENAVVSWLSLAGICAAVLTNNFWTLAVVLLIPQRIALVFIGWWFDWLPHHALEQAQRGNRYRATRIRVGMEWPLTPVMMTFNYHLVHHLHPQLPFYRLLRAWWRNEDVYLEHDPAIATVFGSELTPDEFRQWKQTTRRNRPQRSI